MRASWDGDPVSGFDEDFPAGFVGKVVLVGVTELALDGALASQEQLHGVIVAATAHGIDIALRGVHEGTTWRMPPWLDELVIARPGAYRLRSTGEVVEDPDFVFSLTVHAAPTR
ncbi:MAG TPA: hypothetical protein VIN75_09460 [Burkholderiaceae bacterium]